MRYLDSRSAWSEGEVDPYNEHLELTCGSITDDAELQAVARVSRPVELRPTKFIVQFLDVPSWGTSRKDQARLAVRRELDFYLVKLGKPDPWAYAIYHCGTASNLYSEIHWSHKPAVRIAPMADERFRRSNDRPDARFRTEATGTFWLWAWPELLGWNREITWLFSPVTGNTVWPGDLWGVDNRGELVLVETKSVEKGKAAADPYEDFVGFETRLMAPKVNAILAHWQPLYEKELRFIRERYNDLESGNRIIETRPGIVDCSRMRLVMWRWRELYLRRVIPRIVSSEYEAAVRRNLDERDRAGNPPPHYFALFTQHDNVRPKLTARGKANYELLAGLTGRERLHAQVITEESIGDRQAHIRSYGIVLVEDVA